MRYLRGSAIGVRVAGAVWGGLMGSACLFGLLHSYPGEPPWFILLAPLFVIVRPWSLGVWLTDEGLSVPLCAGRRLSGFLGGRRRSWTGCSG